MSDLNRREFVVLAAAATAACAACGADFAQAGEPPPAKGPLPKGPFDCGPKTKYASDGVVDEFAKKERILIVRSEGKIYAPTATCTHKNCAVKIKETAGQKEIVCPCHGSKFSIHGTSTKGPAKGSLYRYAIKVDDKGNLIVDRDKQFDEKHWDDPTSFVTA
jgi:nitrite reductase/ring-hydroxylating ferredoxin subunit